ncbi:hypothetical protein BDY17DRAFT_33110 [Neohortaea acidophila]|uniref:60Kd inner membrane protein-domain-containing protein n=1 Tax=Neohortaea acidophila TaxID=245834 RepID=A0A6A6PLM1_9PEZI|nr:uncharacterized protein BDY17DRAFT_33110 [Neohortaea acidophila]KAF2480157.1 hypothetical protein BDY17DRAFT_33110 [Neohortaea acidophila]
MVLHTSTSCMRSSFFALPPRLRVACFQNARTFSSTPSPKSPLVDWAVAGPTAVLNGVHSLGIPWSAAIPITAILVRSAHAYLTSTPTQKIKQFQAQIAPLVGVRTNVELSKPEEQERSRRLAMADTPSAQVMRSFFIWRARVRVVKELHKDYGIKESIRLKCGARDGLLPTLLSPLEWVARKIDPTRFPTPPDPPAVVSKDPVEMLAARLEAANQNATMASATNQHEDLESEVANGATLEAEQSQLSNFASTTSEPADEAIQRLPEVFPPTRLPDTLSPHFDPSMQTEGLSFAMDLTLPDPTLILPWTLFGIMVCTSLFQQRPVNTGATPKRINLSLQQRIGLVVASLFVFLSPNFPAAVLLYMIPSFAFSWLRGRWLDWKYPLQPLIRPCKRPIRRKVRKTFGG